MELLKIFLFGVRWTCFNWTSVGIDQIAYQLGELFPLVIVFGVTYFIFKIKAIKEKK